MAGAIRFAIALVVAIGAMTIGSLAGAHTEVADRAPAPGQRLGGVVDHVEILFFTPIDAGQILLLDPAGDPVDTSETGLSRANRLSSIEFEPLIEPGDYTVVHSELSPDGDDQSDTYMFTFDPDAPGRLVSLSGSDDGANWLLIGGIAVAVLLAAAVLAPRRRR